MGRGQRPLHLPGRKRASPHPAQLLRPRPDSSGVEGAQIQGRESRLPELPLEGKVLSQNRRAQHQPREVRDRPGFCAALRGLRIQSNSAEAAQVGRNALRPPQTHPRAGQTPITRAMWRPRRIYPRSYRPEPPETGQAQAVYASHRVERRHNHRSLQEIRLVGPDIPPKTTSFSTTSAHPVSSFFLLRALAAEKLPRMH